MLQTCACAFVSLLLLTGPGLTPSQDVKKPGPGVVFEGGEGPGAGKHVVLVAGDEEYRSEEVLPMLARILAVRHGFRCTVLFSLDPEDGTIDPVNQEYLPGLEVLAEADLLVLFTRFRELPDEDMKHFVDYVEAGKPILGLRTATHAFDYRRRPDSPYARYSWRNDEWPGGFGRQILGETWVNHHGDHGSQSTRGVPDPHHADHPILRGVDDVWGPTDVYGIRELPDDATVVLRGQVLAGMEPDSPALAGAKNDPMMPILWVREIAYEADTVQRIISSTIGAAPDFASEGVRRVLVNSCYWGLGLEARIPARSDVDFVGKFAPSWFGFAKHVKGVRPADHALEEK